MNLVTALAVIAGFVFLSPLIGVLFGAFSGWIVGLFFGPTISEFIGAFSPQAALLETWQIGAGLGFIGGFFKSSTTVKKD